MKALSVFSSRYLRIFLNLSPQLDLSDMKNMIFYGGWGGGVTKIALETRCGKDSPNSEKLNVVTCMWLQCLFPQR